uniref:Uncharacterized protein n=1 Tax=Chlamydomonas leiostraca TaxID=1034604 RepID=A0A7S0RRK6_9CHLO|mmetsp:Transcript_29828/g.75953  ORF Transcript_29828/g.75953 Transcript_29828/m.75953 type:complete len:142 (+) Transcript_29828:186-611(+)
MELAGMPCMSLLRSMPFSCHKGSHTRAVRGSSCKPATGSSAGNGRAKPSSPRSSNGHAPAVIRSQAAPIKGRHHTRPAQASTANGNLAASDTRHEQQQRPPKAGGGEQGDGSDSPRSSNGNRTHPRHSKQHHKLKRSASWQ